jgi:acylphosphatase
MTNENLPHIIRFLIRYNIINPYFCSLSFSIVMNHFNITIQGKVQGVGFRFSAMQKAYEYGISGTVKNDPQGGRVYIEAEGSADALEAFVKWCHKGPWGAKVENVSVAEAPMSHFSSFDIIHKHTD